MKPKFFFVFDVQSIGLHGEGFAVAGGVYLDNGAVQSEFCFACDPDKAEGTQADRAWVEENVPVMEITHRVPSQVRIAFWEQWRKAQFNYSGIVMTSECLWPVEANFVSLCIEDEIPSLSAGSPYPFLDISSTMLAAGMDPLAVYPRTESEKPARNPLTNSRQSARLMFEAFAKLATLSV